MGAAVSGQGGTDTGTGAGAGAATSTDTGAGAGAATSTDTGAGSGAECAGTGAGADAGAQDGLVFVTRSPDETRAFGAKLAESLAAGDFIVLDGAMASGKTCLTQGLAAGLGYRGPVTSPTFTLLHLYEGGRLPLYHFDVYRLPAPEELEGLGYEDYFFGDGVCVVEWGALAADYLPARRIGITLENGEEPDTRRLIVTLYGGARIGGPGSAEA